MTMEQTLGLQFVLVTIVAVAQIVGFSVLGVILYRMWEQTSALGAASFLQGREMKAILQDVREQLSKRG